MKDLDEECSHTLRFIAVNMVKKLDQSINTCHSTLGS